MRSPIKVTDLDVNTYTTNLPYLRNEYNHWHWHQHSEFLLMICKHRLNIDTIFILNQIYWENIKENCIAQNNSVITKKQFFLLYKNIYTIYICTFSKIIYKFLN